MRGAPPPRNPAVVSSPGSNSAQGSDMSLTVPKGETLKAGNGGIGTEGHSCVLGILRVGHSEHVVAVGECDTSETDLNLFTITLFPE